jgi:hypothetical protein
MRVSRARQISRYETPGAGTSRMLGGRAAMLLEPRLSSLAR